MALVFGLLATTVGGLGLLFAMFVMGRRGRPEDDAPTMAAVVGAAAVVLPAPVPSWPMAGADILPSEVGVPRWRRQSLRETRMRSERDAPAPRITLRFRTPAEPGVDRRIVAYSLVRLSSEPDEILGEELGWLDRGDEVEVVETRGVHWLVRTPDGAVGWIHRTTLESAPVEPDGEDDAVEASDPSEAAGVPERAEGEPRLDDFFRFSTGGLGARNGEPRVH